MDGRPWRGRATASGVDGLGPKRGHDDSVIDDVGTAEEADSGAGLGGAVAAGAARRTAGAPRHACAGAGRRREGVGEGNAKAEVCAAGESTGVVGHVEVGRGQWVMGRGVGEDWVGGEVGTGDGVKGLLATQTQMRMEWRMDEN